MIPWLKLCGWRGRYVARWYPLGTFDYVLTHPWFPGVTLRQSGYA